eukprot:5123948-Pyramimonas_sp.AAC.1
MGSPRRSWGHVKQCPRPPPGGQHVAKTNVTSVMLAFSPRPLVLGTSGGPLGASWGSLWSLLGTSW